jgi:hypothetical protein
MINLCGLPLRTVALAAPLSLALLSGCSDEAKPARDAASNSAQPIKDAQTAANEAVRKQLEDENRPLSVTFSNPGMGTLDEYLNARDSMIPFNFYSAKRNWDESADEIAESVQDPIKTRSDSPEFYRLALERISTPEAFKKRELTEKLHALTLTDAARFKNKSLIQFTSDEWIKLPLSNYDFIRKGYSIDSCLLSDKLEYTEAEKRDPALLAKAEKIRCYLNPGPNNYYLGFTGGSSIFLEVSDEALAKNIEAMRESIQISIYGYVKEIQREKLGGNLGPQRYVLIAPQRIDVFDTKNHTTLLTKSF